MLCGLTLWTPSPLPLLYSAFWILGQTAKCEFLDLSKRTQEIWFHHLFLPRVIFDGHRVHTRAHLLLPRGEIRSIHHREFSCWSHGPLIAPNLTLSRSFGGFGLSVVQSRRTTIFWSAAMTTSDILESILLSFPPPPQSAIRPPHRTHTPTFLRQCLIDSATTIKGSKTDRFRVC